jgi:hypothetical protein
MAGSSIVLAFVTVNISSSSGTQQVAALNRTFP